MADIADALAAAASRRKTQKWVLDLVGAGILDVDKTRTPNLYFATALANPYLDDFAGLSSPAQTEPGTSAGAPAGGQPHRIDDRANEPSDPASFDGSDHAQVDPKQQASPRPGKPDITRSQQFPISEPKGSSGAESKGSLGDDPKGSAGPEAKGSPGLNPKGSDGPDAQGLAGPDPKGSSTFDPKGSPETDRRGSGLSNAEGLAEADAKGPNTSHPTGIPNPPALGSAGRDPHGQDTFDPRGADASNPQKSTRPNPQGSSQSVQEGPTPGTVKGLAGVESKGSAVLESKGSPALNPNGSSGPDAQGSADRGSKGLNTSHPTGIPNPPTLGSADGDPHGQHTDDPTGTRASDSQTTTRPNPQEQAIIEALAKLLQATPTTPAASPATAPGALTLSGVPKLLFDQIWGLFPSDLDALSLTLLITATTVLLAWATAYVARWTWGQPALAIAVIGAVTLRWRLKRKRTSTPTPATLTARSARPLKPVLIGTAATLVLVVVGVAWYRSQAKVPSSTSEGSKSANAAPPRPSAEASGQSSAVSHQSSAVSHPRSVVSSPSSAQPSPAPPPSDQPTSAQPSSAISPPSSAVSNPPYPTASGAYVLSNAHWQPLPHNNGHVVQTSGDALTAKLTDEQLEQDPTVASTPVGKLDIGRLVFDGTESVPTISSTDFVIAYVGSLPQPDAIDLGALTGTVGQREITLHPAAPHRPGFGADRIPATIEHPRTDLTLLRPTTSLRPCRYAVLCGTTAYELTVANTPR